MDYYYKGTRGGETTAQTTDSTTTTVIAEPTKNNTGYYVEAKIIARGPNNNIAVLRKTSAIKNKAGTLTKTGNLTSLVDSTIDTALSGVSATVGVSGTDFVVNVSGLSGTTINWKVKLTYVEV